MVFRKLLAYVKLYFYSCRRNDDAENTTPISVEVKGIKHLEAEGKLPIRTCPPTPQCFSATTSKPFRPRPLVSFDHKLNLFMELFWYKYMNFSFIFNEN